MTHDLVETEQLSWKLYYITQNGEQFKLYEMLASGIFHFNIFESWLATGN